MPNQYVNKVVQSNGTTLIDITDTTATASDVAQGKYFYLSSGEKVEGTASGGGGYTLEDIASGEVTGDIVFTGTKIRAALFAGCKMTSFAAPNLTTITIYGGNSGSVFEGCTSLTYASLGNYSGSTYRDMFGKCTSLTSVSMLKVSTIGQSCFGSGGNSAPVTVLVLPNCTRLDAQAFLSHSYITTLDFSKSVTIGGSDSLSRASNLSKIIYRGDSVSPLRSTGNLDGTPFAADGTGGTLFVPNSLIANYQAASNWSTILGYANNQIKSIESTHTDPTAPIDLTLYYADGTAIS